MMNSFVLLLVVSLCGTFVPAIDGLSCYKCSWTDKTCNSKKVEAKAPKEKCGSAAAHDDAAPGAAAPGAAAPGAAAPGAAAPGAAAPGAAAHGTAAPAAHAPGAATTKAPVAAGLKSLMDNSQASAVDGVHRTIRSKPFLSMLSDPTYYCFQVFVKANDTSDEVVERGCKLTDKTDDCLTLDKTLYPNGKVEKCSACSKDDCNSGLSLSSNALLIQFSLLLAIGIAKMFFQTK